MLASLLSSRRLRVDSFVLRAAEMDRRNAPKLITDSTVQATQQRFVNSPILPQQYGGELHDLLLPSKCKRIQLRFNPTYLTGSKIRVKDVSQDNPSAYITSVGLYSADNELWQQQKFRASQEGPIFDSYARVRLDY